METSLEDKLDKCVVEGLFGGGEERMLWRVQRMERRTKFVQEKLCRPPAGEAQIPRHIAVGQRLEIHRGAPLNLMTTLLRIN
jgi:hypothetical protein